MDRLKHDDLLDSMIALVERNISNALRHAEMRRQLADDEHMPPLAFYGAYRIERARMPLAERLGLLDSPSFRAQARRVLFNIARTQQDHEQ